MSDDNPPTVHYSELARLALELLEKYEGARLSVLSIDVPGRMLEELQEQIDALAVEVDTYRRRIELLGVTKRIEVRRSVGEQETYSLIVHQTISPLDDTPLQLPGLTTGIYSMSAGRASYLLESFPGLVRLAPGQKAPPNTEVRIRALRPVSVTSQEAIHDPHLFLHANYEQGAVYVMRLKEAAPLLRVFPDAFEGVDEPTAAILAAEQTPS